MPVPRSTASHASVAYLRICDFAQHAVAEQARLKSELEEALVGDLRVLHVDESIVLEAAEGLAVVVLANPGGALRLAWHASRRPALRLAVGLAHGPVRVAQGQSTVLYGDALVAAESIARATDAGRVLASRDFHEALGRHAPGIARLLARKGSAVDAQDRVHEIFNADRHSAAKRQRNFLAVSIMVAVAILALGLAMRLARTPKPAPVSVPVVAPAAPGAVTFDIKPEGDVYVDGVLKGKSPPLKRIQVPAGNHEIEIRHGNYKPMVAELAVGSDEELSVQHNFVAPSPPAKAAARKAPPREAPPREKPFFQRLKDVFK